MSIRLTVSNPKGDPPSLHVSPENVTLDCFFINEQDRPAARLSMADGRVSKPTGVQWHCT